MEIEDLNNDLAKIFNCKFDKQSMGYSEWVSVFVKTKDNITLGRFSFQNNHLKSFKYYKPNNHPLKNHDEIILRLNWYLDDNIYIPLNMYRDWVRLAKNMKKIDIEVKIQWRRENPLFKKQNGKKIKIRRKTIKGKSTQTHLMNIYRKYKGSFELLEKRKEINQRRTNKVYYTLYPLGLLLVNLLCGGFLSFLDILLYIGLTKNCV